jgi:hypothetical protein
LRASIEADRLAMIEHGIKLGYARQDVEGWAAEAAASKIQEHEKYETDIARYIAAGRTRAFARRMIRLAAQGIRHPNQLSVEGKRRG